MSEKVPDTDLNREELNQEELNQEEIDLDAILLKADPSLKEQFESLGEDFKNVLVQGESLNLGKQKSEQNHNLTAKARLLYNIKKIVLKIIDLVFLVLNKMKNIIKWFYKDGIRVVASRLKSGLIASINFFKSIIPKFRKWSLFKKVQFILFLLSSSTLFYLYFWVIKSNYLNKTIYPYIGSMMEVATTELKYDPINESEPLYGSGRVKVFAFQLKPFIVNLKRVSSTNPMSMVELVIEGSSPDVLIEIKKRESEIRDLIERVIEKKTYDFLETPEGKEILREELRQELNFILLNGEASRIQFINFIIKP